MKRAFILFTLLLTGCSNAPIAGFLDAVAPSRAHADPPRNETTLPAVIEEPRLPPR
jgi:hypothetical protein